jgi:Amt family ammonium transporter
MDTDIGALIVIFTEFYYWVTIPLMFLIHVGFCIYEVGACRAKNTMHKLIKNTMVIPSVTLTFFLFGCGSTSLFPTARSSSKAKAWPRPRSTPCPGRS